MTMLAQFLRYATIGVASNVLLYLLYLVLTYIGVGHKTAATLCYLTGAVQAFMLNKRWAFRHQGRYAEPAARFVAAYMLGYFLNLLALLVLVDYAGYPHQAVQASLVLAIALVTFALSKYWVFSALQRGQA